MWIKTQDDASGNCMVNLDKVEAIMHLPNTMDGNGSLIAELGDDEDFYTLFEGTQEDCEALLSWIFTRFDYGQFTADINQWIESHKPVNPDEFPEILGEVVEKEDVPFQGGEMTTWTIRETERRFDDGNGALICIREKDGEFVFECDYNLARKNIF